MTVTATSIEAWRTVVLPKLGEKQADAFEMIQRYPKSTNAELSRLLHWPINTVTPRVKELRDARLVQSAGVRKCRETGRNVMIWEPVDSANSEQEVLIF